MHSKTPDLLTFSTDKKVDVLSQSQLDTIKAGTFHILENVGVRFPSKKALKMFSDHGAMIDWETEIVRLTPDLVEKAMSTAPRSFVLGGREERFDLTLDGQTSYLSTDGCGTNVIDLDTREERRSRKEDVARMARICDALPLIGFFWPLVSAQDHGLTAPLHECHAGLTNTLKHVRGATTVFPELARYLVEMATVVSGSEEERRKRPPICANICGIAPLTHDEHGIEAALVYAEAGIPSSFMAMPNLGSTSPATMSGALAVGNAEVVSAMVLMQLVSPGAPVFHSLLASVMDPRSGNYITGISEKYLCNAAAVQLAHDWGVPSLGGAYSVDCQDHDSWQLGRDSVYTSLFTPLVGADLVEGLGLLKAATLLYPEQIIYDDEIYHTHRILAEGIDTSADKLAIDVIRTVGPGGHFMGQKHTRRTIRDIWLPKLTHPNPVMGDSSLPDIRQRARDKFNKILTEHKPIPLDKGIQNELVNIMKSAEKDGFVGN
jgi:trimethylamine--corrinoid protein Co-methyltransferase